MGGLLAAIGLIGLVTLAVVVGQTTATRAVATCPEPSWQCQDALAHRRDAIVAEVLAPDGVGRARARRAAQQAQADVDRSCPRGR